MSKTSIIRVGFFILYFSLFIRKMFRISGNNIIMLSCLIIGIAITFYAFSLKKTTISELALFALLTLLGIYMWFVNDIQSLIFTIYCSFIASHLDIKKVLKSIMQVSIVIYFITVILAKLGLIENTVRNNLRYTWGNDSVSVVLKNGLGFGNPNAAFAIYFSITLMYFIVNEGKIRNRNIIISTIISVLIYIPTQCRTGLLVISFMHLLLLFRKKTNIYKNKVVEYIVLLFCPIMFILSYVLAVVFNNSNVFMYYINLFLSRRLFLGQKILSMYTIKMLGQPFSNVANQDTYLILDSGYLNALVNYGWIVSICFVVLTVVVSAQWIEEKRTVMLILLHSILLYGFMETLLLDVSVNCLLLFYVAEVREYLRKRNKNLYAYRSRIK